MPMRMSSDLEAMYELAGTYAGDGARDTGACIALSAALALEDNNETRAALAALLPEIRAAVRAMLADLQAMLAEKR